MTFVFEKIDKAIGDSLVCKVRAPIFAFQLWQVIDRSRNVILVSLGGKGDLPKERGEPPTYYNLLWQDCPVVFNGYITMTSKNGIYNIEMVLNELLVPAGLVALEFEIKRAIQDAMSVYWGARRNRPVEVQIHFPAVKQY
jgi:hypothetical protein